MDKLTLIIALTLLASASAFLIKVPVRTTPSEKRTSSTGWIHLQKLILPLFENICEDSTDPIIVRLAQEFNTEASSGLFLKPEVINDFNNIKSNIGLLRKGETFVVFKPEDANVLKVVYNILYYAKNFDTFYKAAAWARQNVNCGLFINAIYFAMLNRRDTERLSVPAPYELLPNYFVRKDYIIKASSLLSNELSAPEDIRVEGNSYIIDTNYTSDFNNNEFESKLAYFCEDIGLNTYYFLQRLKFTTGVKSKENQKGYGEYLYHTLKQLTVRYDLERYANGFPEVEEWNKLDVTTYDPMLIYSNGDEFGYRTETSLKDTNGDLEKIKSIEMGIKAEVTRMVNSAYSKASILDYLMDVLITGELSYEALSRRLVGTNMSDNNKPTALAHYLTSLRDPDFWRINKKIVNIIEEALKLVPGYSKNELMFPGIQVLNVEIKKMSTSFDDFVFDVTDALKPSDLNTNFQVKFAQPRLNHKAFSLKLNISSAVMKQGLVKIFLGPKVAPGTHVYYKNMFMLLDSFEWNFKIGSNVISRSSEQMNLSEDFTMLQTLKKIVDDAEFGIYSSPLKPIRNITGFPSRLFIPKGTSEGLPLQVFVFVAPFSITSISSLGTLSNDFNSAVLSPSFPLDLDITSSELFRLPNTMIKDVIVTHKGDSKVSEYGKPSNSKPWQGGDTNYDYSANQKETFDYSSRKGQYGKKNENSYDKNINDAVVGTETTKMYEDEIKTHEITNPENIENTFTGKSFVPVHKEIENIDYSSTIKPLLKAYFQRDGVSKNDYSYKRKERFDYKTKKDQYRNKANYSVKERGDEKNVEVNNDSNKKNYDKVEVNSLKNYNEPTELFEVEPVDMVGDLYDIVGYKPLLKLSRKRAPTVYDYLFPNSLGDYSEDYKIYE